MWTSRRCKFDADTRVARQVRLAAAVAEPEAVDQGDVRARPQERAQPLVQPPRGLAAPEPVRAVVRGVGPELLAQPRGALGARRGPPPRRGVVDHSFEVVREVRVALAVRRRRDLRLYHRRGLRRYHRRRSSSARMMSNWLR